MKITYEVHIPDEKRKLPVSDILMWLTSHSTGIVSIMLDQSREVATVVLTDATSSFTPPTGSD